jgi:Ca-activated chloride channel family protein
MRRLRFLVVVVAAAALLRAGPERPADWLANPAQRAQWFYDRGRYDEAATLFRDPLRRGNAWYRAGDFGRAAAAYALRAAPEADFNRGNALLLGGDYDAAIEAYEAALAARPAWAAAMANRSLAVARRERLARAGEDRGRPSELGADQVVFDPDANPAAGDDDDEVAVAASSDAEVRALWLRRVSTRPGDFLARRFAAQLARDPERSP